MHSSPMVSVAMATYNGEKYIDEQINSIINQSYKNIELIIIDDCSTDNTWEKIYAWQQRYPAVVKIYKNEQNIGINKNFEKAFSLSKGEWIAISDQDDVWYPNKLERLMECAVQYPEHRLFHHNENELGKGLSSLPETNYWLPYEGNGANILFVFNRLTGHKAIFHTSLLEHIIPIPEKILYDWWINVVASVKGNTKYVPDALMDYRKHAESAYFSNVDKHLADVTEPIRNALKEFGKINGMRQDDTQVLHKFQELYDKHTPHKFDVKMFFYLVKKRNIFFKDIYTTSKDFKRTIFLLRLCRAFSKW